MRAWVDHVLAFWFGELSPPQWFLKSDALDQAMVRRFSEVQAYVAGHSAADLVSGPAPAVAALIVLDQFPRNMFRGTPKAFATDPLAREVADRMIAARFDGGLPVTWRSFVYLPFEHSESADDQARSVALFEALGAAEPLEYARKHKAVIDQFGRFPHRNAILGRPSTPEERAYLAMPGAGF
jgi:uncharacterized protein (DUF924 family)